MRTLPRAGAPLALSTWVSSDRPAAALTAASRRSTARPARRRAGWGSGPPGPELRRAGPVARSAPFSRGTDMVEQIWWEQRIGGERLWLVMFAVRWRRLVRALEEPPST